MATLIKKKIKKIPVWRSAETVLVQKIFSASQSAKTLLKSYHFSLEE